MMLCLKYYDCFGVIQFNIHVDTVNRVQHRACGLGSEIGGLDSVNLVKRMLIATYNRYFQRWWRPFFLVVLELKTEDELRLLLDGRTGWAFGETLSLTGQFIAGTSYTQVLWNPFSWRFLTQLDKTTLTSSSVGRKILLLAVILD